MIDLLILMCIVIGLSLAVYHIALYSTTGTSFEEAIIEQRKSGELGIGSKHEKVQKKPKIKKPKAKKDENNLNQKDNASQAKPGVKEIVKPPIVALTQEPTSSTANDLKKKKKETVEIVPNDQLKKKMTTGTGMSISSKTVLEAKDSCTVNSDKDSATVPSASKAALPAKSSTGNKASITNKGPVSSAKPNQLTQVIKGSGASESTKIIKGSSQVKGSVPVATEVETKTVVAKKAPLPQREKKQEMFNYASSKLLQEQMEVIENQLLPTIEKKKKIKIEEKKIQAKPLSDDVLSRVLPIIQKSKLNGAEIQMLIETLLNKQQLTGKPSGEWVEKGRIDPAQQMKRQLEEAESKLKEQTSAQEALLTKITTLRTDLNGERAKSSNFKKQLDEANNVTQQKLDTAETEFKELLKAKIIEAKLSVEQDFKKSLVETQQKIKAETDVKTKQLENSLLDVEKQLQQARVINNQNEQTEQGLENALIDVQTKLTQAVHNRDELMQRCQQYQQHINVLKEQSAQQDVSFNSRVCEMQESISASEDVKSKFYSEREQLKQQLQNLEGVRELLSQNQVKLKETVKDKIELENKVSSSRQEVENYKEIIENQRIQIQRLIEEKDSLASQSVRPAAEGQENGDIHPEQISNNNLSAEYEEKFTSFTKEISRLKEDLSNQRRKNDELRTKNHKVMEALGSTEESLRKKLKEQSEEKDKYDRETRNTIQVLLRLFPSVKVSDNLEQVVQQVETTVSSVQTSEINPEIIEKVVEKVVQDPALAKQIDILKKENADLHSQVQKLSSEVLLSKKSISEKDDLSRKIQDMDKEKKALEDRVTHYQNVLSNTESLLKTLQSSVESEEAGWKEKFLQKEEIICHLNADKTNLLLRVTELQSDLEKVKQAEEMDSQLTLLKEKLDMNEKENGTLKEQLQVAKDQLKSASLSQAAYKVSSMGFMVAWINNKSLNSLSYEAPADKLCNSASQSKLTAKPSFTHNGRTQQVVNANGPANGVDNHEDENSLADTSSLVSASSASVSEGLSNLDVHSESNSKKKKKKKSFLSKIIG